MELSSDRKPVCAGIGLPAVNRSPIVTACPSANTTFVIRRWRYPCVPVCLAERFASEGDASDERMYLFAPLAHWPSPNSAVVDGDRTWFIFAGATISSDSPRPT